MLTQRKTFPSFDTFTDYIVFVRRDIGNDVFHDKIYFQRNWDVLIQNTLYKFVGINL